MAPSEDMTTWFSFNKEGYQTILFTIHRATPSLLKGGGILGTKKLSSGSPLPAITLPLVGGGEATLGTSQKEGKWQLVFVYRGLHCPICKQYLKKLESLKEQFIATRAEIVAISGDPAEKAAAMVEATGATFDLAYGLSIEQMQDLGLLYLQSTIIRRNRPAFS